MHNTFFVDQVEGLNVSYQDFFNELIKLKKIPYVLHESDQIKVFKYLVASLVHNRAIIILDSDLSHQEVVQIGYHKEDLDKYYEIENEITYSEMIKLFHDKFSNSYDEWTLTLFTSGTTGVPKKVQHTFNSLNRYLKVGENHKDDKWAFAYNPTHIAGLQVFFQAFLNMNPIINVFRNPNKLIKAILNKFEITHISATPTFFRLLDSKEQFKSVKRVTSGGEKLNKTLFTEVQNLFPKAKILNTYASTETGTLFASDGEFFKIPSDMHDKIKIIENEVFVHESITGKIDNKSEEWISTGDLVEYIDAERFKILSRTNDEINVGGYKVNLLEIEAAILEHPEVKLAIVSSKENSLIGNIVQAEVVKEGDKLTEKEIRVFLKNQLQEFKIPRIIKFVDNIELGRTGKIKRNYGK